MKCYMGIDIGTSSTKTLLMQEDGTILATAQQEYDIIRRQPGYAEQNMDEIWKAVQKTVKELAARCSGEIGELEGISYSGQMHGLVMVDEAGTLIRDAIIWADQRAGAETKMVYNCIGKDTFHNTALNDLSSGFLLTSLLWVKFHEPENYKRIFKVLLPKDYIRFCMCGKLATDYSDASASMAFDTGRKQWAWDILDQLNLDRCIFPECHESYEIAGELTPQAAEILGLKPGIPVVFGGGDSLMQEIGNGVVSAEDPWICNIGTSCSLNCAAEFPVYDKQFRTNTFCHVKENLWMLMGANLCGGIVLKWLKNQVFYMNSYDQMTSEAETVKPGSEGLLFLPYLSGSRCPVNDPEAKGVFTGLTLNHTRAHMIRSAMEGIVFGMKTSMEIFKETGIDTKKIIASGGGARGKLFLQMEADILEKEVITVEGEEQACVGAAITAAVGTGAYKNFHQACERAVHFRSERVEPIEEHIKIYRDRYPIYEKIYDCIKPLY